MLYKPMNDNGLHHMLWLSVSLDGHVSLGDGEVRGGDGDGVTTEITVLGGGRKHCSHWLALVGQQRTQHRAQMRWSDCSRHQQLLRTEHCQHHQLHYWRSPTVHLYTPGLSALICCSVLIPFLSTFILTTRCKIKLFITMARSQVLNWLIVMRMDKSVTIQASSCIISASAQDLSSLAI